LGNTCLGGWKTLRLEQRHCTPRESDLGLLASGKHALTVRVDKGEQNRRFRPDLSVICQEEIRSAELLYPASA